MITCEICGLDVWAFHANYVYDAEVCFDCIDIAEAMYEGDEESDYIENMAFDHYHDR